jgi:putative transposase
MLALTFDMLVFETLNIRAMQQLWGRKIGGLGFADFLIKAQWMAKKLGRDLVRIGQWEPSTKSCHLCGYRQDMPLTARMFKCRGCGNVEDRDLNAACNIWEAGSVQ